MSATFLRFEIGNKVRYNEYVGTVEDINVNEYGEMEYTIQFDGSRNVYKDSQIDLYEISLEEPKTIKQKAISIAKTTKYGLFYFLIGLWTVVVLALPFVYYKTFHKSFFLLCYLPLAFKALHLLGKTVKHKLTGKAL